MNMPPRGHPAHPEMQGRFNGSYSNGSDPGPGSTPIPKNTDEQIEARKAALQRFEEEWFGLVETLSKNAPPFNAKMSHLHFTQDGYVMREGLYALGSKLEWKESKYGPESKRVTDTSKALMPARGLRNGAECPIHGSPCTATVSTQKFKLWSVTFETEGWQVGAYEETHNGGGRGDVDITSSRPMILTKNGKVLIDSRRAGIPMTNREAVADLFIPPVDKTREQDVSGFRIAVEQSCLRLRRAVENTKPIPKYKERSAINRWFTGKS